MVLRSELTCLGRNGTVLCDSGRNNVRRGVAAPRPVGRCGGSSPEKGNCRPLMKIVTAASLAVCAAAAVYGYRMGIFTSVDALRRFIAGFGRGGALAFIVFQALQVVVPILPGGLGCLGGVLMFGAWKGFLSMLSENVTSLALVVS
jgi:hypothetical protein